ncbi:hypothetical protein U1Q18_010116 [Sarracenia purpurea var. burkii]
MREEELALFLEMRKRDKERNNFLLQNSEEFDAPLGLKPDPFTLFNITSSTPAWKTSNDDFLNSNNKKMIMTSNAVASLELTKSDYVVATMLWCICLPILPPPDAYRLGSRLFWNFNLFVRSD